MLYKGFFLTSKIVDKTLMCDHSSESYWAVLSCGTVLVLTKSVDETLVCEHSDESY